MLTIRAATTRPEAGDARDSRPCTSCHKDNSHDMWLRDPFFAGLDVSRVDCTGLLTSPWRGSTACARR